MSAFSGTEMIVWGGRNKSADFVFGDGGIYDVATNSWSAMSIVNAPSARFSATSVWTGNKLIVYGGQKDFADYTFNDGAIYDRTTNTWTTMNQTNAPSTRRFMSAVWTGTEMIV